MNIFRKKPIPDTDGYYPTDVTAENLAATPMHTLTLLDEPIILVWLDDAPVAFSAVCPHAAADLGDGDLHRGRITCPDHEWKFDIRTGRTLYPEDEACRLKQFPAKIIDNIIWIKC